MGLLEKLVVFAFFAVMTSIQWYRGGFRQIEVTVDQLRELRNSLSTEDPTAVMKRRRFTPHTMPHALDPSNGEDPPLGLPPPDKNGYIWLRGRDGPISILDYTTNGNLPSLPVLTAWKVFTPLDVRLVSLYPHSFISPPAQLNIHRPRLASGECLKKKTKKKEKKEEEGHAAPTGNVHATTEEGRGDPRGLVSEG